QQSLPALEYLEESFPATRTLLPPPLDSARRAKVRELVSVIVPDPLGPRADR
ncbi:hypothetical protein PILCRDRAFT_40993, partial [Piloderma croceum F 1598]